MNITLILVKINVEQFIDREALDVGDEDEEDLFDEEEGMQSFEMFELNSKANWRSAQIRVLSLTMNLFRMHPAL